MRNVYENETLKHRESSIECMEKMFLDQDLQDTISIQIKLYLYPYMVAIKSFRKKEL